jgi:hypothetical protein
MYHSFNVLLYVSAFQNAIIRDSRYEYAEMVPNVVKRREGWELHIVTDGVRVGIYPDHYAVCYNIQLPSFSAFNNIGHHLSMFISDALIMAF